MNQPKKKKIVYIIGSIVFTIGAWLLLPKLIDSLSNEIYRRKVKKMLEDDEEF